MAGVLQEAGDADSKARNRSQVEVEYFIIPYISTFIRLSHLCQEFYVHSIIIIKGGLEGLRQFLITENPLKMIKNAFYFTLKALFFLKIFRFSS